MSSDVKGVVPAVRPTFAVVVPTYDRPARLRRCLQALAALDYPKDRYGVFVVDDGSPTPAAELVRAFEAEVNVRVTRQPNAGPAAARNTGAKAASGDAATEYLAFTDDDCAPEPEWLAGLARQFAGTPEALVGGRIVNDLPHDRGATASQAITDFAYARMGPGESKDGQAAEASPLLFATANLACPVEGFRRCGGFDLNFPLAAGEDYDFCHRWQRGVPGGAWPGGAAAFCPDAVVRHAHAMSTAAFWRQHFAYGRGLYQFRKRAATREGGRSAGRQPLTFYRDLVAWPLRQGRDGQTITSAMLTSGLVAVSQLATAAGAVREAVGERFRRGTP